ncbi:hypothetical protein EV715DRAFT_276605 [Schizophyllum commune]
MSGDSRGNSRRQREREEGHAEKSRQRHTEESRRVVEERFARERDEPEEAGRRTTSMSAAERSLSLCGDAEGEKKSAKLHKVKGNTTSAKRKTNADSSHLSETAVLRAAAARQVLRCAKRDAQWSARDGFFLSVQHALGRYRVVSAEFDRAQFSIDTYPLVIGSVPWPTLVHPSTLKHGPSRLVHHSGQGKRVQGHLSWEDVELFLRGVKQILRPKEYQELLRKARLQFHPDKWASRGILESVLDDELRVQLHTWCVIVSQAVNAAC